MLVGLREIITRGFSPADVEAQATRRVRMLDESDSGFGLEGDKSDCGEVGVGDLVGMRLRDGEPPVLCYVSRRLTVEDCPTVRFGLQRLSSATQPMKVLALNQPGAPPTPLMFVPGADSNGRHDGFIVSDTTFEKGDRIEVEAASLRLTLRFNRVRERGRGWVLAGYEVVDVGVGS
jgi:hypothetical protein